MTKENKKLNCYKCKHRGGLAGDCHSRCKNPKTAKELGIEANTYGVSQGWFYWPVDFDPIWLISCNGFEVKEDDDE